MITDSSGIYVDCTFGLGGHTSALSSLLNTDATLIGIDQDRSALDQFSQNSIQQNLHLVCTNFENLLEVLADLEIQKVNGILLDLGLNSFSLDDPERGFAFGIKGPLDMRFDRDTHLTAEQVVNEYSEADLANIMFRFGEERHSRRIAKRIAGMRMQKPLKTSEDLKEAVRASVDRRFLNKSLARVFQAIRIEVNRELDVLHEVLEAALQSLFPAGRIAVISYHSLEDRIVKNFFRDKSQDIPLQPGMLDEEVRIPQLARITKKPITATAEEIALNPRSRSAKLRVAERTAHA